MDEVEMFRHRDLPHWDVPGAAYFITSCLEGSIPAQGLLDIRRHQNQLRNCKRPADLSDEEFQELCWKLTFARIDKWLDHEPAVSHLSEPVLATIVHDSLLNFAGTRYDVYAFVVMPSHFHWVFRARAEWVQELTGKQTPRERIMKGVKSYSASRCNIARKVSETFWQPESYDHWIRNEQEFFRIINYIEKNPVVAGFVSKPEDWLYSSAYIRKELGLPLGAAIPKIVRGDRPSGLSTPSTRL